MSKIKTKKLYAYVDESGQDTKGFIFVVSVLVFEKEKEILCDFLEDIEKESQKRYLKWNKSKHQFREKYIEKICVSKILKEKIFFEVFSDTKKYIELTSYTTAKAILRKSRSSYKATIFVDGFRKKEIEVFTRGLRDLQINTRKVRGVKKDENNAFIRLVDAICGLVRDADSGNVRARGLLRELKESKIVTEI